MTDLQVDQLLSLLQMQQEIMDKSKPEYQKTKIFLKICIILLFL